MLNKTKPPRRQFCWGPKQVVQPVTYIRYLSDYLSCECLLKGILLYRAWLNNFHKPSEGVGVSNEDNLRHGYMWQETFSSYRNWSRYCGLGNRQTASFDFWDQSCFSFFLHFLCRHKGLTVVCVWVRKDAESIVLKPFIHLFIHLTIHSRTVHCTAVFLQ
jgi:hypothetical protein